MAHPFRRPLHLLRSIALLVRTRQYSELAQRFRDRLFDDTSLIGLRLDPRGVPGPSPEGAPVRVRTASRSDLTRLLDLQDTSLERGERHERAMRLQMGQSGVRTCYVAEDQKGVPCFVQWLVLADQNDVLQEVFGGWYPPLREDEAMLEFAYTPPTRRGQGIMGAATPQILGIARDRGVRSVVTFIPTGNSRSLRIHLRMGFVPYVLHLERRRLGFLKRRFVPVSSLQDVEKLVQGFDATQFEDIGGKPMG